MGYPRVVRFSGWVAVVGIVASSVSTVQADQAPPPEAIQAPPDGPTDSDSDSNSDSEEDEESGVDMILPVGRMGWGTSRSVEPGDLAGFTFDLVLGSKLLFQELGEADGPDQQRWRPVLTGELGYTRRAGDYDELHDLTLGIGFGFSKMYGGLHLFETVVFGVSGQSRFGLRTTLRLEFLQGLVFMDVGHEVDFTGGTSTHDIRGVIGIDIGLLVSIFVFTSLLG